MKYKQLAPLLIGITSLVNANEMTVQVDPFLQPQQGFSFLESPGLRYSQLASTVADDANASTHILIQGLTPLKAGSNVSASPYEAINLQTGEVQDVGMVYLTLPAGAQAPEGSVTSPIVGIVQRDGAWSDLGVATPATTVGGAAGPTAFDSSTGTLNFSLNRGGDTFTGTANYTVIDMDTIELDPFTLTRGSTPYSFKAATLVRSQRRFYGTIVSDDSNATFDNLLFEIQFVQIPDADLDGIPDIVDPDVSGSGLEMVVGQWRNNGIIGDYYALNSEWAYSPALGFFKADTYPKIYQIHYGWLFVIDRLFDTIWLYSPDATLSWLSGSEDDSGMFRASGANPAWDWVNLTQPRP